MTAPVQGSEPEHLMQSCWMGMDEDSNFFKLQLQEQELTGSMLILGTSIGSAGPCPAFSTSRFTESPLLKFTELDLGSWFLLLATLLFLLVTIHTLHLRPPSSSSSNTALR